MIGAVNIFKADKLGYGNERHLFATAFTPDGMITYADSLSNDFKKKYVLTGGPGFGKTDILKFIGSCGQKKGYFIEYMHDPFVPERIEHIFIPEISTCIITNNEIGRLWQCTVIIRQLWMPLDFGASIKSDESGLKKSS